MRTNTAPKNTRKTFQGGQALPKISPEDALKRTVMACMLFENNFYENGQTVGDRIKSLSAVVGGQVAANIAFQARCEHNLRHAPLMVIAGAFENRNMAENERLALRKAIRLVCRRPDDMTELLSLWWANGRRKVPRAMLKGLADSFDNFDEYQFAKYASRPAAIRIKDVMFLAHPKPEDDERGRIYKAIADDTLAPPGTWEQRLSSGENKAEVFTDLLRNGKLGYMALLRNLRTMALAGVDESLVKESIVARKGAEKVLPFRYYSAVMAAPQYSAEIDQAMQASTAGQKNFSGRTIVLVDVSASMNDPLSSKSTITRMEAAALLASMVAGNVRLFTFSDGGVYARRFKNVNGALSGGKPSTGKVAIEIPSWKGLAGVSAVYNSQAHAGTMLGQAIKEVSDLPHDRLIVLTDEQSCDTVGAPPVELAYMVNVGTSERSVGYGKWVRINGFSEAVLNWIHGYEEEYDNGVDS